MGGATKVWVPPQPPPKARPWAPPASVPEHPKLPRKVSELLTPTRDRARPCETESPTPGQRNAGQAHGVQGRPMGCSGPESRAWQAGPERADPQRAVWPGQWGGGWRGALTEVAQAVLPGIHAHLQRAHQLQVLHLGQGLLQSPGALSPGDWTAVPPSQRPSLVALWPVPASAGVRLLVCGAGQVQGQVHLKAQPRCPGGPCPARPCSWHSLGIARPDPVPPCPAVRVGGCEGQELVGGPLSM